MSQHASKGPFVAKIGVHLAPKLRRDLEEKGFSFSQPPYTLFSAKKKGVSCTLYESGKLVVQGKESGELIEFYLEPEILKDFSYSQPESGLDLTSKIGVDEAGKGDFFGPLCVAAVFVKEREVIELQKLGVKDSKGMTDRRVLELAKLIRKEFSHHIVRISPQKYNEIYPKFSNLNRLLAWGHSTVIERLAEQTGCKHVLIDQFASEHVVETALKKKNLQLNLTQRHRGEEDLVVAAASILARAAFLEGLQKLGDEVSTPLPKGASPKVTEVGKELVRKYGKEVLRKVGKLHFKTLDGILSERDI